MAGVGATMPMRFGPNHVYPFDDVGAYIELTGCVVHVGSPIDERSTYPVTVDVGGDEERSGYTGYVGDLVPQIGDEAVIRVYDAGGGWYPDNRIISLAKPAMPVDSSRELRHVRVSGMRLCDYTEGVTMYRSELVVSVAPSCLRCAVALSRVRRGSMHPSLYDVTRKE